MEYVDLFVNEVQHLIKLKLKRNIQTQIDQRTNDSSRKIASIIMEALCDIHIKNCQKQTQTMECAIKNLCHVCIL